MTGVIISLFAYWSCVSICSSHLHYCPGIYVFMLFLTFIILIFSNLFYLFPEVRKIWFYELQRMCYPIYIFSLFGNMCSTFGIKIMAGLSGCGLFSYALISISFARLGSHGKFCIFTCVDSLPLPLSTLLPKRHMRNPWPWITGGCRDGHLHSFWMQGSKLKVDIGYDSVFPCSWCLMILLSI